MELKSFCLSLSQFSYIIVMLYVYYMLIIYLAIQALNMWVIDFLESPALANITFYLSKNQLYSWNSSSSIFSFHKSISNFLSFLICTFFCLSFNSNFNTFGNHFLSNLHQNSNERYKRDTKILHFSFFFVKHFLQLNFSRHKCFSFNKQDHSLAAIAKWKK